jgi:hypothetical protein
MTARGAHLSEQQERHYRTFGFVKVPGLLASDIATMTEAFEEVFARVEPRTIEPKDPFHYRLGPDPEASRRLTIMPFVEEHDALRALPCDERVQGVVTSVLGDEHRFLGSDGNLFFRNTPWHADLWGPKGRGQVKLYIYLDPLDASTGAVRMIPGTHHVGEFGRTLLQDLARQKAQTVEDLYGIAPEEIPSVTIDTEPGDVLVADLRTLHATFNGVPRRRLITLNFQACGETSDDS